ncbi:hypothetical protein GCM10027321_17820 [Massilia terrae]
MLNAIGTDSYIRPHRHALDPKTETLFALRGQFALVLFDDSGAPRDIFIFGSGAQPVSPNAGVELPPGSWHTVIALSEGAILFEVKAGPFRADAAKELAPWAPEEGSAEAPAYFERLRRQILEVAA